MVSKSLLQYFSLRLEFRCFREKFIAIDSPSPENVRYDVSGLCLFIIHIQGWLLNWLLTDRSSIKAEIAFSLGKRLCNSKNPDGAYNKLNFGKAE